MNIAIEKHKQRGLHEIFFYTIPSGFRDNNELVSFWKEKGYQAEIIDGSDGYGILHISWTT